MRRWILTCVLITATLLCGCDISSDPSDSISPSDSLTATNTHETITPRAVLFIKQDCLPCDKIKPIFEQLSIEYEGKVDFSTVDCDTQSDVATEYNVMYIPSIIIIDKHGELIHHIVGFKEKEDIQEQIDSKLKFKTTKSNSTKGQTND